MAANGSNDMCSAADAPIEVQGDPDHRLRIVGQVWDGPVRLLTGRFLPDSQRVCYAVGEDNPSVGDGPVSDSLAPDNGGVFSIVTLLPGRVCYQSHG